MQSVEAFIARLPKVELHVHLVGSAPIATVLELARRHPRSPVPRTAEGLRELYAYQDFPHFIDVYQKVSSLLTEPEDIAGLVRGVARDLAAQNVRYAELQVSPYPWQHMGMPNAVITEALDAGAGSLICPTPRACSGDHRARRRSRAVPGLQCQSPVARVAAIAATPAMNRFTPSE